MRSLIFVLSMALSAVTFAQADTIFVIGADFGSTSALNDSTWQVIANHPTDDLGQGFSGNGVYEDYLLFDVLGNIFRVDSVLSKSSSLTILWVVEQQNSIAPIGKGIVYRSPENSNCVPRIPFGFISNATIAKIHNHNTVNGCGGAGGGGGSGTVESVVAGTGINVDNTDPANPIINNTAQDQAITLTEGANMTITGSYPNFTLAAAGGGGGLSGLTDNYLPVASSSTTIENSRIYQDLVNHNFEVRDTSTDSYTDLRIYNFDGNTNTDDEGVRITAFNNNVDGSQVVRAMGRIQWSKSNSWLSGSSSLVDSKFTLSTIVNQNLTTVMETNGSNAAAQFPSGIGTIEGNVLIQNGILTNSNTLLGDKVTSAVLGNFASRDFGNRGLLKLQFNNQATVGYSAISGLQTSTYNFGNDRDGGISFYMTRNGVPDRETFIFNEEGQIMMSPGGVTHTRAYDLNFQNHSKGLRLPVGTTAGRTTGVLGYFNSNSTISGFEGHNGTSFFRFMQQSDVTPIDGQVGVWDASTGLYVPTTLSGGGTMSSFDLAADTGTPATIEEAETVTLTGGIGIDTEISSNAVTATLDLSEIAAYTALSGNEYFANYDAVNGNALTHIDTLTNYIIGMFSGDGGIYSGNGTIADSAWITLPSSRYWRFESDGGVDANLSGFTLTTSIFGLSGNMQYLSALGGGDQKISVSNLGLVSFSTDDRALANSVTADRPAMWTGTGNELSSFPMEQVASTTRFTQSTSVQLPTGSTAFEATPADGSVRYDSDTDEFRIRRNGSWVDDAAKEDIYAQTYLGYTGNSSSTITPVKSLFVQAVIGTGDTYTLTIDDSDVPTGAYMDVFNSGPGDLVLDRSSGNFVTTTGSPATITITDNTARFVFSGTAWYQIH